MSHENPVFPRFKRVSIVMAIVMTAVLLQVGCSPTDNASTLAVSSSAGTPEPSNNARTPEPSVSATVGGDGSDIQLDALTESDLAGAELPGELACSFSTSDTSPILLAKGFVGSKEPAQGVVKVAGSVERVSAPGGFDEIEDDPTFMGQGKTIKIVVTGHPVGGGESPSRPATLTYERADGASRTLPGHWQCGP